MRANEQTSQFIDAAVEKPELARSLAARNPRLLTARWIHNETVLHFLSVEGFTDAVRLLLDLGADPNTESEFGHAPLIDVVLLGNLEIAALLISAGANVNATSDTHDNVIHCAVQSGNAQLVELLLKAGARTDYVTETGETILDALPQEEGAASHVLAVLEQHGVRRDAV